MGTSLRIAILAFALILIGCTDDCADETVEACQETPATDEACQAYFQRWFFVSESNACEQIGYSGCNEYGFATEVECSSCACN